MLRLFVLLFFLSTSVFAQNAAMEERMSRLSEQLRCLVCQNQTLEDSNADLAIDLRKHIRAQIEAGKSDEQILDFLVQRYGEFVLYKPRLRAETALLWFGPLLFLAIGAIAMVITVRKRATRKIEPSREEHEKALEILNRS
ncbi:MAG: cytochrome c-type biogenesis protein [Burkholderiales bacterium]